MTLGTFFYVKFLSRYLTFCTVKDNTPSNEKQYHRF